MRAKHGTRTFAAGNWAAAWRVLGAGLLGAAGLARADTNVVIVRAVTVTNQFEAIAQVEPIAVLPLRAAQAGVVTGPGMVPGALVRAGQEVAKLGGPEIQALLAQDEAAVRSARANLFAARKTLTIERQQLAAHLVTRRTVLQAEGAAAQAQAAFDSARAQLQSVRQTVTLKAPADGTVLAVNAAEGERVGAGEKILTLQPADKLWLKAAYYGSDMAAIHVGITGQYSPAGGGEPAPVKVCTVFGALAPDGGESVGLLATGPAPGWRSGEFGTVTLNGAVRSLVAVPTRALILDQGRWWVLVRTEHGDHRRAVTPGPARGWETFIERGLEPGAEVVVDNAYLEFHRGISKNYRPPD
ncbi:MAG: efflux RND transporter periplasmic adaptor subunit [Verrucomicrobiota bacterium]|nr:efflux RND transporter periplasmic adaptor subunit [Verrucomicrobiota bacterium]